MTTQTKERDLSGSRTTPAWPSLVRTWESRASSPPSCGRAPAWGAVELECRTGRRPGAAATPAGAAAMWRCRLLTELPLVLSLIALYLVAVLF